MTEPNANGGIYFHTAYQEKGFPRAGIECQVNVSHSDWIKTGSLYGLANFGLTSAQDNQWWTQEIIVKGNKRGKIEMHAVVSPNNVSHRRAAGSQGRLTFDSRPDPSQTNV